MLGYCSLFRTFASSFLLKHLRTGGEIVRKAFKILFPNQKIPKQKVVREIIATNATSLLYIHL